jgi:hypothetical protein
MMYGGEILSGRDLNAPSLTQAQVDALPDNTRVMVKWCGGNGPWEYITHRINGIVYARTERGGIVSELDFVGSDRCHTKVWLLVDGDRYVKNDEVRS